MLEEDKKENKIKKIVEDAENNIRLLIDIVIETQSFHKYCICIC